MRFRSCLPLLLTAASLASLGCHGQSLAPAPTAAAQGKPLPPDVAFRVEALLRRKASNLPPGSSINIAVLGPAKRPGFQRISVSFTNEGHTSHAVEFELSDDAKTLEQVTTFDIAADPKTLLPPSDRPFRGGPKTAPVLIIGFDDLECPYCARLHNSLFPLLTQRYGDKVHFEYRDYPLNEIHPWALHAAIDVNCLAVESPQGYWDAVDYIHAHAADIGADPKDAKAEKTMDRAAQQLDTITREQGAKQKVDMNRLNACVAKQDRSAVDNGTQLAESLNLGSTPVLFINGNKIDGAVPLDFLFGIIDNALRAEGVTPPPPYVAPAPPPAQPASPQPAAASPQPASKTK